MGETPLQLALMKQRAATVDYLIGAGAKFDPHARFVTETMCNVASNGNLALLRVLIENKAPVDVVDDKGRSPLELAKMRGFTKSVKLIAAASRATPSPALSQPQRPVQSAPAHSQRPVRPAPVPSQRPAQTASSQPKRPIHPTSAQPQRTTHTTSAQPTRNTGKSGHSSTQQAAVSNPFDIVDWKGRLPVTAALLRHDFAEAKRLIRARHKFDVKDKRLGTMLSNVASSGDVEMMQLLIQFKPNMKAKNYSGSDAMETALRNQHADMIRLLFSSGSSISITDGCCLCDCLNEAVAHNKVKLAQTLISMKAPIFIPGETGHEPVDIAKKYKYNRAAQLVLSARTYYIERPDEYDIVTRPQIPNLQRRVVPNALTNCASQNNYRAIKTLVTLKANVNAPDSKNRKPLIVASELGHSAVVHALLQNRADISASDSSGRSAISAAASRGKRSMINLLLAAKASLSDRDSRGYTPLHCAVERGHAAAVKALLEARASPQTRDSRGFTSLDLAAWKMKIDIVDLLVNTKVKQDRE